jgi:hypothetical protein
VSTASDPSARVRVWALGSFFIAAGSSGHRRDRREFQDQFRDLIGPIPAAFRATRSTPLRAEIAPDAGEDLRAMQGFHLASITPNRRSRKSI